METVTNLATAVTNAATNAAAAATRAPATTGSGASYWPTLIWLGVILAAFIFIWRRGYLVRIRNYVAETREELRKCTWPTVDELKGSTVVVMVTVALLGVFTVSVDWVLSMVMRLIT